MKTEMGMLELKDGQICYEIAGEGEALVLSHAGFVDSGMWNDQWEPFAESYRVIRYDMRGYGKSSKVDGAIARRDDLHQLLNHLKVDKAHLLGCSMGGAIIIDYALEHPERVLSLIPVSAVPDGFEMRGEVPPEIPQLFAAAKNHDYDRQTELQLRLWVDGPYRQPDQVNPKVRERAAQMSKIPVENATFINVDTQPLKPLDPPAVKRLGSIQVPTLILVGALDNPEIVRAADLMQFAIPGAKSAVINDTAHVPNMEKPDEFNEIVMNFLSGI